MAGQNRVEPILRRHAESLGAELRYSTELVSVEQDAQGVIARVRDLKSGEEQLVRAQYLIAADGHRSRVRDRLGIGTHGYGTLSHNVAVVFEGNIEALIGEGRFALYYLQNPRFTGVFVNADEPHIGGRRDGVRPKPASRRAISITRGRCALCAMCSGCRISRPRCWRCRHSSSPRRLRTRWPADGYC